LLKGLDQTRGWFYTLTILAVALFDSVAFKNCITTGMILAEDGRKMSKSLKNYPDPEELLNEYGGDSLRAYLIDSPVVRGEPLKFSEEGVKLVTRNIILPLWNSFSFFSTYANADEITFEDLEKASPIEERNLMDRWIISSLQSLIKVVNEKMENYYLYEVIPPLMNFVDELTNWYVRSNRKRFWKEKGIDDIDKINAFKTLHEVLIEFNKAMAPVLPFICEKIYQGLIDDEKTSIHYCDYPESNPKYIDKDLEESVDLAKKIIKSVRNLRVKLKLPNKQPLKSITIISNNKNLTKQLAVIENLIMNEVNIKEIKVEKNIDKWIDYEFKPNYEILGPSLGKEISKVAKYLSEITNNQKILLLESKTIDIDGIKIDLKDINVNLTKKKDVDGLDIVGEFSLLLDTELNDDLLMERMSRELVSHIQKERKNQGYDVTDRIELTIISDDEFVQKTVENFSSYIKNETLAIDLETKKLSTNNKVNDRNAEVSINKLTNNS
jgi:isoleucyl-tRNA synthetase